MKSMPDNKLSHPSIELLNQRMNQLAREISAMDPDDLRRIELIDEMSALSLQIPLAEYGRSKGPAGVETGQKSSSKSAP